MNLCTLRLLHTDAARDALRRNGPGSLDKKEILSRLMFPPIYTNHSLETMACGTAKMRARRRGP